MFEHKIISLSDQILETIETDILSGKYVKGTVLTEMGLSAELGVSRTPIREAMRILQQEHLIEDTTRGMVVVGVCDRDIQDIFEIRLHLEGEAAYLAAENRSEEDVSEMKRLLDLQEFFANKKDAEQIKAADSKFHQLLYKCGGSIIYYDTLVPLHKKAQKYRRISLQNASRAEKSVIEHRAIYEAIANKDAEKARIAATTHVRNAAYHIITEENK